MIDLIRLPGYDANGNPRYVCHYLNFLTEREHADASLQWERVGNVSRAYAIAIQRAKKIGGKKYRAKWYGGGIVFTDYENVIKQAVKELMEAENAKEQK